MSFPMFSLILCMYSAKYTMLSFHNTTAQSIIWFMYISIAHSVYNSQLAGILKMLENLLKPSVKDEIMNSRGLLLRI